MYHYQFQIWPEHNAERIAAIWNRLPNYNATDLFLPWDFILHHVLYFSIGVVLCLTVLYVLIYTYFDSLFQRTIFLDISFDRAQKRKICYQMINFFANLCLGCAGLYCELYNRHHSHSLTDRNAMYLTVEETTLGYENVVYFSAGQIGYQIWAIPMGIWYMNEPLSMIVHHFTVIVCASMSGFLVTGFRYWTPFFYGLVELSSVPLAIMNAFKDHPTTLQQRYPLVYKYTRLLFAATFLYIRIGMFVPRKFLFLRDHLLLWTSIRQRYDVSYPSSVITLYQCFMATVWLSAFFLLVLQTYWATLIIRGIVSANRKNKAKDIGIRRRSTSATSSSMEPSMATASNHQENFKSKKQR